MIGCIKMHSNGNDFILINNMALLHDGEFFSNFAVKVCRRRESVGADGLLVAEPSCSADFKMRIFNPDGSEGEMCGNGARCISRFALEYGIAKSSDFTFETLAGIIHAEVNGELATLDLFPISLQELVTDGHVSIGGYGEFEYYFVMVGVPHCVIFEQKRKRNIEDYVQIGRAIRNRYDLFPHGTHVNFVVMGDKKDEIEIMTYERGVEDVTLSCGTGSVASSIVSWFSNRTGPYVLVKNPGGVNKVSISQSENGNILTKLQGRALFVAELSILSGALY